jgi:hypothetical protein
MNNTIVNISISMEESASARSYVISPHSFVFCSIWPYLNTESMSLSILDLAFIYCAIWEYYFLLEFKTLLL